jgi:hypothetical protein
MGKVPNYEDPEGASMSSDGADVEELTGVELDTG